jgi:hypothetical protein
MYPPRPESDSGQQESDRAQGVWSVAILWVAIGLFTILTHHGFLSGSGQIGIGIAFAANEIMSKKAAPRSWRIVFKISAALVLLTIFLMDWRLRK